MVLTRGTSSKKVNEAMSKGHVINAVTKAEIAQMKDIYKYDATNKKGIEQGYKRGENGTTSKTVTGVEGKMDPGAWEDASKDLHNKGTTAVSDAHLHPLNYDKNGNIVPIDNNVNPSHYPDDPGRGDTDPAE